MGKKLISMSTEMEIAVSTLSPEAIPTILRLLEEGESINARQRSTGATLLMLSIKAKLPELARLLVEKGADINAKSAESETALIYAARIDDADVVRLLLERGANPNNRSRSGWTAMQWAILANNNENIAEIIRQAGGHFS